MLAVRDEDYENATSKLVNAGFIPTIPDRRPAPEVMKSLSDPEATVRQVNEGYKRVDISTRIFNYSDSRRADGKEQVILIPSSFANLPSDSELDSINLSQSTENANARYDTHGNIFYPLEQELLESLVKAAVDEETHAGITLWAELLRSWISMMMGYLGLENDILDNCSDEKAVTWYSTHFGRIYEAKYGPMDRRVTKRLGSGKEMPVDMSRRPVS